MGKQASSDTTKDQKSAGSGEKPKDGGKVGSTKKGDLLGETTLGNKAQRKADWAIMKEMSKYLWPKV